MENFSRRKFIATAACALFPFEAFAKSTKTHIQLLKKPFAYYVKKGKQPGKRVLIIGGIHGNEIGAYKASDILVDCDITRGELIIIPRSNFTSILADVRGYNGDMNRKFATIKPNDPDKIYVDLLKEAIREFSPDVVISMHDGFGFASKNPHAWGQSIVIDEQRYNQFDLYKEAAWVQKNANRHLHHKLALVNTQTFSSTLHKEQRSALTGWCLRHNIKAFCIESSKQLQLHQKIYTHLVMLREFFKLYHIELSPSIDTIIDNDSLWFHPRTPVLTLDVNGTRYTIHKHQDIRVPRGSRIRVVSIDGNRGTFLIGHKINLNWQGFYFSKPHMFLLKEDYKTKFTLNIYPV